MEYNKILKWHLPLMGALLFAQVSFGAPVISGLTATPGATTATITWVTNVSSTSRVDYGTSSGTLNLNSSNATLVTNHSVTLTGLTAGTTYYYKVTSVDGSNGSTTSPSTPASFTETVVGVDPDTWDIDGSGDPTIQGFTTDISGNLGDTMHFKIKTTASAYHIDIYRMGYYGGNGAALITSITPSATLPQTQPACLTDTPTGLIDCGNWADSATWTIPLSAKSGIYFARLTRTDTQGASHIVFVVRDDSSHSDIIFQTSDETWQAYNQYGGNDLYIGGPGVSPNRAYKVSYNRPITTRGTSFQDFVFSAEYPMVRWLEANGYDVSYMAGVDSDRNGALIRNHKTFLAVGHDEYWSGNQRTNVEAARDAGINLVFLTGNEVFWKTRWEASISSPATNYRTMVCYKETHQSTILDPLDPPTWTGSWRDPRFSPPADGGRPENAMTGTSFLVNSGTDTLGLNVPAADGKMRFWRNTTVATQATGSTAVLTAGMLGYEWDQDADNGARPAGLIRLSTTSATGAQILLDYGHTYGTGSAVHNAVLYRKGSALVFGAGATQWTWGLDSNHDGTTGGAADVNLQQAMVNLFADMHVQPTTLQTGLVFATASSDSTPPTSVITAPAGSSVAPNSQVTISGTASDVGGVVGGVEVSVDGGSTWHPATGRSTWSYTWDTGGARTAQIVSRATDDSGNIQTTPTSKTITVLPGSVTIWQPTAVPYTVDSLDASATEVGMKFRVDIAGSVTGVRFYKSVSNVGPHIGNVWSSTGTLLGRVTFSNESASGWQQATFSPQITVAANTTYVVSYFAPSGHYSQNDSFFASSGIDVPPLHALANGVDGPNGIYSYGAATLFPTSTYHSQNYWVDVVFADNIPPVISGVSVAPTPTTATITWTTNETSSSRIDYGTSPGSLNLNVSNASLVTAHSLQLTGLTVGTTYYYRVTSVDTFGNSATSPASPNSPGSFTAADVTPPVISAVAANPSTTTAPITWTTDELSTSRVDYGTSPTALTLNTSSAALVTSHSLTLSGLATGTTFYYRVTSADGSGNSATSPATTGSPASFQTIDPNPPVLSAVTAGPGVGGTATIAWISNKLATSRVDYGTSSGSLTLNVSDPTMVTTHSLSLSGLTQGTTYYFRVTSVDPQGHSTSSPVSPATASFVENALSVWNPTATPATIDSGDPGSLELGMKFRSDLAGVVTGVRFYKAATNTGSHIGNLWSSTGTRLGTVSFTGETASGWQQANFASPISILPNTTYVISYFDPAGHDSETDSFFASTGVDNPPLHALANGVDGFNGIYLYTTTSAFPTATYRSDNYWVDVVFSDNVPPVISGIAGAPGGVTETITWTTNEASTSRIDYGTSSGSLNLNVSNASLLTAHSLQMTGLTVGTTYYYRVTSIDASGNSSTSPAVGNSPATFTAVDLTAPVITAVAVNPTTTTAAITWTTDELSNSRVDYGTTPTSLTLNTSSATRVTSHSLTLSGLASATTYYYRVTSADASGNSSTSPVTSGSPASFQTVDPNPPVLSAVTAGPSVGGTATIAWISNKLATSRVDYGTSSGSLTLNLSDPTVLTAHSLTLTGLTQGTTYYFRVTSVDPQGHSTSSPVSPATASFVENALSVWNPSATPTSLDSGDPGSLELGMKFRSDVAGVVTGVRFYKAATNTGSHIGNLWSSTGTLLGSVGFTGETASGWQQANFASAVSILPNTTYVISYFAPAGHYSESPSFFASTGVDNPPLHALANGVDGFNGIYLYTSTSAFPTATYRSDNYSVDLVFSDNVPPAISAVTAVPGGSTETITWTTDEASTSRIDYGTSPGSLNLNVSNASLLTAHNLQLTGLTVGTTYYYRVTSIDASGNSASSPTSSPATFTATDVTAPVITAVAANPTTTTAAITWTTDEASNSRVDYGTSPTSLTLNTSAASLVTSHSLTLSGLAAGTTYYYRVTSADGSGNSSTSPVTSNSPASFQTVNPNPPVISAVTAIVGINGVAAVTWTTDKPTSSRVDYDTSSGTLTLNVTDPTLVTSHSLTLTGLTTGTTYFYRVTSTDSLNNTATSPAAPATLSFTEAGALSIWNASGTPSQVDSADPGATELGMKFQSDVPGIVTGVLFYKAATNTGTHIGNLWTSTGTLLGSVVFTGETASGWQQATFSTPIAIAANTTYVISYFAPSGHYSQNSSFFAAGVDNAPLHALAAGVDGPNGLYIYSSSTAFPSSSFSSSNYWVDVVFSPQ